MSAPFDPYENVWRAFDQGQEAGYELGLVSAERIEAISALVIPEPELATVVAQRYEHDFGLQPGDLRWMILPDALPVTAPREEDEPIGVHLNIAAGRQVRYRESSPVERAVLQEITDAVDEHVMHTLDPKYGTGIYRFGKILTPHQHVIAREKQTDGLDWTNRSKISLEARQQMHDRAPWNEAQRHNLHERVADVMLRYT